MRLEQDVKLDYKDVLIRPKRSTLNSRTQVQLERKFTFRNDNQTFRKHKIMKACLLWQVIWMVLAHLKWQTNLLKAHLYLSS